LHEDIYNVVHQFFQTGVLLPEYNRTYISLIPKISHPESLDHFRPISLCNFIYKIISKILANRLKPWLPELVTLEESAFVGGRQIQDNIIIVQEVLHQIRTRKRKKHFQAVLKLDMQKAYDRVEWDFLRDYLLKIGFHTQWVKWILQCVTTVSFGIKFNGEALPYFQPTRGLRQGDPLSPYLFILMANALTCLINNAVHMGHLSGI